MLHSITETGYRSHFLPAKNPAARGGAVKFVTKWLDHAHSLGERKNRLKRLRDVVLAHRSALGDAVSADFGHRSRHETNIMELVGVV